MLNFSPCVKVQKSFTVRFYLFIYSCFHVIFGKQLIPHPIFCCYFNHLYIENVQLVPAFSICAIFTLVCHCWPQNMNGVLLNSNCFQLDISAFYANNTSNANPALVFANISLPFAFIWCLLAFYQLVTTFGSTLAFNVLPLLVFSVHFATSGQLLPFACNLLAIYYWL